MKVKVLKTAEDIGEAVGNIFCDFVRKNPDKNLVD